MTKVLNILISYKQHDARIKSSSTLRKGSSMLEDMTHIFRMNFWEAFSLVRVYEGLDQPIDYLGLPGAIKTIMLIESDRGRLNETEGDDYILCLSVAFAGAIDRPTESALTQTTGATLEARESILRQTPLANLLNELKGDIRGHSAWFNDEMDERLQQQVLFIAAFYFYAWVLLLRIERNQVDLDITPNINLQRRAMSHIITQRIRLINIERFFLTEDRSNRSELKELCMMLSKKYRIQERFDRATRRHTAFEHHLDNTTKALQAQRAASLSNMIAVLTLMSVPLAAMQVFFGINVTNSLYADSFHVFFSPATYLIIGASILCVLIPLGILRLVDWKRRRRGGR